MQTMNIKLTDTAIRECETVITALPPSLREPNRRNSRTNTRTSEKRFTAFGGNLRKKRHQKDKKSTPLVEEHDGWDNCEELSDPNSTRNE